MPEAYILHSDQTQSRTIVNYRDLPGSVTAVRELTYSLLPELPPCLFIGISLEYFLPNLPLRSPWFHFEGNYVDQVLEFIEYIRVHSPTAKISVEVEKPNRVGIERLIPVGDVVFFSKAYAQGCGFADAESFLRATSRKFPLRRG